MKDTELYDRYERTLEDGLVKICRGAGLVDDMLLRSDDIDARWDDYIKDYVADAVENFNIYPEAAISWAGFLGIAVAHWWDADWQGHKDDPYQSFYGTRGWDDMDEHVLRDLETQTEQGFFVLTRSYSVLYRIGAGIELQRLGYKAVPINIKR